MKQTLQKIKEETMEEGLGLGKKSYGTETDTETRSWFRLPIPKPGFGCTLAVGRPQYLSTTTLHKHCKHQGPAEPEGPEGHVLPHSTEILALPEPFLKRPALPPYFLSQSEAEPFLSKGPPPLKF